MLTVSGRIATRIVVFDFFCLTLNLVNSRRYQTRLAVHYRTRGNCVKVFLAFGVEEADGRFDILAENSEVSSADRGSFEKEPESPHSLGNGAGQRKPED